MYSGSMKKYDLGPRGPKHFPPVPENNKHEDKLLTHFEQQKLKKKRGDVCKEQTVDKYW